MVIKLDGLSEKEKKAQLEFAFLYPKSFELIKKEGAKTELKSIIEEMNECKLRTNCENSTSFWINKFEKRLKELKKGGKE